MRTFIFFLLLFVMHQGVGQNLVQNPGFEEYTACPFDVNQVYMASSWQAARQSPDYYNTCAIDMRFSPPNNIFGHKYPRSGNAQLGVIFRADRSPFIIDESEYIQNTLFVENKLSENYYFSCYLSLSGQAVFAVNNIGIILNNETFMFPDILEEANWMPKINNSDFLVCEPIQDSVSWVLVSGAFQKIGEYKHITIGNFYDYPNNKLIKLNPPVSLTNSAYYFIDDVCLSHNPATCPARQLDLLPPTATCVDGQVVLDAGPGSVHYAWVYDGQPLPCDTGQTIVADRAGWYRVVVGRQQPCGSVYTFTDSVFVSGQCRARLQPCQPAQPPATFALPNVFSPNNDGLNDTWPGTALPLVGGDGGGRGGLTPATRVTLYSRWGVAVYSGPLHPGWDGRAPGGTPATEGVYAYTLHTPAGQLRSGTVTLVR